MIVENVGYLKLEDVLKLEQFSIYETKKKTHILFKENKFYHGSQQEDFYYPKKDRLPWKVIEGKKICNNAVKVFDSKKDSLDKIDTSKWNNGNQIMSYQAFSS
jgi:hypothetical protein